MGSDDEKMLDELAYGTTKYAAVSNDVKQAMTWAAEIAALQVKNAAAHVRIAELEDANAKILQTAVDRIGELEARIMTLQSFPVPRVSPEAFPPNAIRHSR